MHKHLDLFSGIGGFSLGLEATGGFETVAFCDYEPFCQKVLRKHWEEVPIYKDVKELTYEKLKTDGIDKIDIITGGYPCQPFSVAGKQKGEQDPRHVWPEMFRLIKELRPTWVIGENVSGHIKLGLDTVLENLESEGYSTRTFSISASSIGANHQRERVWIVAFSECNKHLREKSKVNGEEKKVESKYRQDNSATRESVRTSSIWETNNRHENVEDSRSHSGGIQFTRDQESFGSRSFEASEWSTNTNKTTRSSKRTEAMADTNSERQQEQRRPQSVSKSRNEFECSSGEAWNEWWEVEPNVGRVVDGLPKRVDRLKSLGNSVIPHIPYYIGQSIIKSGEIK
jgi:DNA (cytosine-5)-methyltransferase 1